MKDEKIKTIYELGLHEETYVNGYRVMRVPGGWIYDKYADSCQDYPYAPIFVPFNNEFHKDEINF